MAYDETVPEKSNRLKDDIPQMQENFSLLEAVAGLENYSFDEDDTTGNLQVKDDSGTVVLEHDGDSWNVKGNSLTSVSTSESKKNLNRLKKQLNAKGSLPSIPNWDKSSDNPIIDNTSLGDTTSGIAFVAIAKASRFLSNPIDDYYLWGSSHDDDGVWLWTASDPTGPWDLDSTTALFTSTDVPWASDGSHLSSPDVLWDDENSQFLLYFHCPVDGYAGQATGLAKSSDGETNWSFTSNPVIPLCSDGKWCSQATSYARLIKEGGNYTAVFQANASYSDEVSGGTVPMVGLALSQEGEDFTIAPKPIVTDNPDGKGLYSPTIHRWGEEYLIIFRTPTGTDRLEYVFLNDLKTHSEPEIFLEKTQSWESNYLESPNLFFDAGKIYLYYSGNNGDNSAVGVAEADFSDYEV